MATSPAPARGAAADLLPNPMAPLLKPSSSPELLPILSASRVQAASVPPTPVFLSPQKPGAPWAALESRRTLAPSQAPASSAACGYDAVGAAPPQEAPGVVDGATAMHLLVPWLTFVTVFALESFSLRRSYPGLAHFLCLVILVLSAGLGLRDLLRHKSSPAWASMLFFGSLLAWAVGLGVGMSNYTTNMQPSYDLLALGRYTNVDPAVASGNQFMDAGALEFAAGASVDLGKSMSFLDDRAYCVAPIVSGSGTSASYDFWAAGVNCCSHTTYFACGEYNNPDAHSGLRLMQDEYRPFFRLAVQQAEAAYGITAAHPIFVQYMRDPGAEIGAYASAGLRTFLTWMFATLAFQLVAVLVLANVLARAKYPELSIAP